MLKFENCSATLVLCATVTRPLLLTKGQATVRWQFQPNFLWPDPIFFGGAYQFQIKSAHSMGRL